ncbi:MAG: hypothetical protein AAGI22_11490 [Planctomycetota bacterium]
MIPTLPLLLAAALPAPAPQSGGERALLLVDPTHPDALHVANVYAAARSLPGGNVLFVDPDAPDYAALVAGPMQGMLGEIDQRGLEPSVDFVVLAPSDRYRTQAGGYLSDGCSPVNHFGLASAYGMYDYADDILAAVPLSAPALRNEYEGVGWRGRSFRGADSWRGGGVVAPGGSASRRMLIPARLGWTGNRGNTVDEVLDTIVRSVAADGTAPSGTFYYMETTDAARSGPRDGLYTEAVMRMAQAGGVAEHLMDVLPLGRNDALGVMTGWATPDIDGGAFTLLPGAFADHLTSFAGHFDTGSQTKMSRWIAKGASGTSGAIEEPCNYASKFPHPRVHTGYRYGVRLGEAWLRSRGAIPLQSMFLGDPLTQPWPLGPTVDVPDAPAGPVAGLVTLTPAATPNATTMNGIAAHELFVDGVLVDRIDDGSAFQLDVDALAAGPHSILVRTEDATLVRHVGTWSGTLVAAAQEAVTLQAASPTGDLSTAFALDLATSGGTAEEIVVRHLGRVVASLAGPSGQVVVHGRVLGAGPVRLVAEATFASGRRAVSAPIELDVADAAGSPVGAPPTAYGYRRTLRTDAAFVLDLPATFDDALDAATFTLVRPPSKSTVLGGDGPFRVLQPLPGARGVDLVRFRVDTPGGSSEIVTIQVVHADAGGARVFCRAAPNDAGPGARLGWSGSTSIAADDLVLDAAGLPLQSFAIAFRGQGFGEAPVGNGFLCVTGSQVRLATVQADVAGDLAWPVAPGASMPVTAGSTWGFQLWFRDVGGAGYGFSDALAVTFQP